MLSALYGSPETNIAKNKTTNFTYKIRWQKLILVDTALMLDIKGLLHRSYAPFFDPVSTVSVLPQAFDDLIEDAQQDTPQARQKQTWILKKRYSTPKKTCNKNTNTTPSPKNQTL